MLMEKFLWFFSLATGGKTIGWFKMILNTSFAVVVILGVLVSAACADVLRKIFNTSKDSKLGESGAQ